MSDTLSFWWECLPRMLDGLLVSLQLTGLALVIGLPLGLLLAVGASARLRLLRWLSILIVEVGRGVPALVMLYVVYFGLPALHWSPTAMTSAVVGLSFTTSGYSGEYLRGGLRSVSRGSIEAAHALAMRTTDVLRFVIVPQGLRVAIPSLMGLAVQIFQCTSLAYSITVNELTANAYNISSSSFRALETFALAGLLYAIITIPASWVTGWAERRLSQRQ